MKKLLTRLWFKFQLSQGKLIKVNDSHRGIGKTTMLVKRSVKHSIPILVGNQQDIDYIKSINSDVEVIGFAPLYTLNVTGRTFPNGVLLEQSVASEMHDHLEFITIKGGFINEG